MPFPGSVKENILTGTWTPPDAKNRQELRHNLRRALQLFAEAGYRLKGRSLVNVATNSPLEVEFLVRTREQSRLALAFADDLKRIGITAIRISAEVKLQEINKQLVVEQKALQEANAALRSVLARIEEEKQTIYKDTQANVDKILIPILHELTLHLPNNQRKYAEILRTNLENITSPFANNLSQNYLSLTSTEIGICSMIEKGLQTKEIAQIRLLQRSRERAGSNRQ